MTIWVLLLRGINVGGRHIVPMKELRLLLENLGHKNVQSYIQSGNCVFKSSLKNAKTISLAIEEALEKKFGFRPQAHLINSKDFIATIDNNPYPVLAQDGKSVHFSFLSAEATQADLKALTALCLKSESFTLTKNVFYFHAPEGIGRSKLAATVEKKLGVSATARNLNTVMKIAAMINP